MCCFGVHMWQIVEPCVLLFFSYYFQWNSPSVLWPCWFDGRKSIQPLRKWVMSCWRGYPSGVRSRWLACGAADATANPPLHASAKSRMVYLCYTHPGCPGKKAVKRVCVCFHSTSVHISLCIIDYWHLFASVTDRRPGAGPRASGVWQSRPGDDRHKTGQITQGLYDGERWPGCSARRRKSLYTVWVV